MQINQFREDKIKNEFLVFTHLISIIMCIACFLFFINLELHPNIVFFNAFCMVLFAVSFVMLRLKFVYASNLLLCFTIYIGIVGACYLLGTDSNFHLFAIIGFFVPLISLPVNSNLKIFFFIYSMLLVFSPMYMSRKPVEWLGIDEEYVFSLRSYVDVFLFLVFNFNFYFLVKIMRMNRNELKERNLKLEESINRNSDLIKILFHDLRNPLVVCIQYTRKLLREVSSEHKKSLIRVDRGHQLINEMIENIMHIYGPDKYRDLELKLFPVELKTIVERVVSHFESRIISKSIEIIKSYDSQEEYWVSLDSHTFQFQVLSNVLSNAIKFSPVGGRIYLDIKKANLNSILLLIRDEGSGMDKDIWENRRDDVVVISKPGTHGEKGVGIGLGIVQRFAKLNKIAIQMKSCQDVNSDMLVGTEFTMLLPRNGNE